MKSEFSRKARSFVVAAAMIAAGVAALQRAGSPATAQAAETPASATKGLQYATKTLANGMKVVVCNDPKSPVVAVQVWYHVGSKNEEPTRQGFAHMFEHMMFRGTDRLGPKSHFEFIRQTGGDCNAYTAFDNTTYVEKLPAHQLELALYLESERMAFLKIDDDSFFTERSVVEEERRMGLNRPYGTILERALPQLFTKHPYMWSPIGQIPHLRRANIDELNNFWQTYYVPNNATLVVVGAVDPAKTLELADKYFGWIPAGGVVPTVTIKEPQQTAARTITLSEPKGPVGVGALAWRTVPNSHPDWMALEVLGSVLGGGESSRLYQILVKDKDTATLAASGTFGLEQDGLFIAGALQKPFGGPGREELVAATMAEIDKIKKEGITADELDRAKVGLLKSQVEAAVTVEGKAQLLGQYAVLYGDLDRVNRRFDEIRAVTLDDVKRVANTYLVADRANTLLIEPAGFGEMLKNLAAGSKKEEETVAVTRPTTNRTVTRSGPKATAVRPASYPTTVPVQPVTTDFPKPATQTRVLANGLKVVVLADHQIPLVNVTLGFKNGAVTEPQDVKGVSQLAAAMVTQGTEHFSSKQLAQELDRQAISLAAGVGEDAGNVGGNCLSEKFPRFMELLGEVTLRPTFPEEDFRRVQQQTVTSLTMSAQAPEYLAGKEFDKRVYGSHPYGHSASPAEIRALKPANLRGWWETFVRPESAVLYIAGDVDPEQAFALAEKQFGAWKVSMPLPALEVPAMAPRSATTIYLVDKPGQVQSQIRVGQLGITRKDSQWAASRVLNQIFGGSFGSRLNETIRVKRGLTYGAGGGFSSQKLAGALQISTFSKTATTAETVSAIMEEVKRLQDDPITETELSTSKNFLLGSFAGDRETPSQIIGDLWLVEYTGLPETFMADNLKGIAATSDADVKRVATSVIEADKMVIVVVGDAAKVKAQLEKIAPVVVLKADAPQAATAPSK